MNQDKCPHQLISCFVYYFVILLLQTGTMYAQMSSSSSKSADSLKNALALEKADTAKVNTMLALSKLYFERDELSTALAYAEQALETSEKAGFTTGAMKSALQTGSLYYMEDQQTQKAIGPVLTALDLATAKGDSLVVAECYGILSLIYHGKYDYGESLKYSLMELTIHEQLGNKPGIARSLQTVGATYATLNNDEEALKYFLASLQLSVKISDDFSTGVVNYSIGDIYMKMERYDEALQKDSAALKILLKVGNQDGIAAVYSRLGHYYQKQGDVELTSKGKVTSVARYLEAINNYVRAKEIWQRQGRELNITEQDINLADVSIKLHDFLAAQRYLNTSLEVATRANDRWLLAGVYSSFSRLDSSRGNFESAYTNYKKYVEIKEGLNSDESKRRGEAYKMQYEFDKKEALAKAVQLKKEAESRERRYILYFLLGITVLIVLFLLWNNRQKQKAKNQIEKAYEELKATQQKLIQSEKMASLGELTAGIAHEIQNPLNFVNNFSEVNKELLAEMREELTKGNLLEASLLAKDVEDNQDKINEHGKRAESIVKGMLLHSRSSSGEKEPTDINKQTDEFIRLAYHGFRAKDKNFNASIETNYDPSIGAINVVPQELGRVLLNLFNNAFYAVNEKKNLQQNGYEPIVSVSTKRTTGKVSIRVRDNGKGIPEKMIDKVFQPFFTTKPTGQGTGLGLSLAYDIIKAHGGEIKVRSVEGEYTQFDVSLPI